MSNSIANETGLAMPKTRRGRRSRGKGSKPVVAVVHASIPAGAVTHHAALGDAMASGDAPAAKSSALMLAKALHAMQTKKMPVQDQDDLGNGVPQ